LGVPVLLVGRVRRWSPPFALTGFVALGGALAAIAVVRGLFDPDFFWHVAVGQYVLDTRSIPATEPFSFTWTGREWIPDQWLGEVFIAVIAMVMGDAALLAAFGILAALGPALVVAGMGRDRLSTPVTLAVLALIGVVMLPQVTARPQVISFALMGAVLALLLRIRPSNAHWLWLLPLILTVWANVHGYFIVGLVSIGLFAAFTVMGRTQLARRRWLVLSVAAASLLGSTITPHGPSGLLYAASFLDVSDLGTRAISEWQSPDFHSPQFVAFFALIGLALAAGINRAPGWTRVLAVGGILAGLFAARAIGIGAIVAMPALLASLQMRPQPAQRRDRANARAWMELGTATMIAVVVLGSALASGPVEVDERRVPVAAVDTLAELSAAPRVLADYGWGGYAISRLYPEGGRVFVDGRMHKYAPDVLADYLTIIQADPGWDGLLDRYRVDAIVLEPAAPVVDVAADSGWCEVVRDERQVLLMRSCPAKVRATMLVADH
jgi:hypothetical protein